MAKFQQKIQLMVALVLLVGLFAPTSMVGYRDVAVHQTSVKIQPALAQIAAESPDEMVRLIVQKADGTNRAESYIETLGGQVVKELNLINAFVALLPGKNISGLVELAAVNYASVDGPVLSMGKPTNTQTYIVRDDFSEVSYFNNDGLAGWKTEWFESDPAGGGAESGNVYIPAFELIDEGNYLWDESFGEFLITGSTDPAQEIWAERAVDLSDGVESATLSLSYRVGPATFTGEDVIRLMISNDGGQSYQMLSTISYTGGTSITEDHDILDYASADTRIRFLVIRGFDEPDAYLALDNIQVEYEGNSLPNYTYLDTINVRSVWEMGYTGTGIGVAVIDSGISVDSDLNLSARTSFNPNSNSVNDVYGHGTHVAGIIGMDGSSSGGHFLGIAPEVDLIGLKISDENGMAFESDTVEAMEWILDNKDVYNIRVVNLSIQSAVEQTYNESALNAAAEILWFNGIVVVAASGNWDDDYLNPIYTAPANDPFVITVGATTEKGTTRINDDAIASYSASGETQDFFLKPEIYAPGTDIISVLSKDSAWDVEHPDRSVFGGQYFRISGTSMAAPMVSGAAALLLQAEPDLTPDQVKYRLMTASSSVANQPYLDVYAAITTPTTESANQDIIPHQLLAQMAMIAYWANAEGEENIDWENVDWAAVNWNAVNWNAVNWNAVNWNAVNWNAVNWNAVNWNAVNWNAVNWNAVNWNAVNWNAVNWNAVNWNSVYWIEE